MGTITANIRDETESGFRNAVKKYCGIGKGKIGMAIDEALEKWKEEKEQKAVRERALKLIREGFDLDLKRVSLRRVDMYEDRDKQCMPR